MILALLTTLLLAAPTGGGQARYCEKPTDCDKAGVCLAGTCQYGSDTAAIRPLYTLAVPPALVLGDEPWQRKEADAFVAQLRRDLQWSGFYTMLSLDRMPFSYRVEGVSPSEVRRLLWQRAGAFRIVRVVARPHADRRSLRFKVRIIEVESFGWIDLSKGEIIVRPGEHRRMAAACVNRLIGLDTGLPGVVGSRIATSIQTKPGVKEIGLVTTDGIGPTMVTSNGSLNLDPAWDGRNRLGYMSYKSGNPDWVVDGVPVSNRPGMNSAGAWSRDGRYLALSVSEGANSDIVILDGRDGTEQVRVTEHPGVDTSPTWSPDGRKLAFVSDRSGSPQIWIVTLATGDMMKLTRSGYNVAPDWSPNGQSLVYGQLIGSKFIIKRRDFDHKRTVVLTNSERSSENPSFSADGRYLVFSRRDAERRASLWMMHTDGSHARPLTSSGLSMFSPAWHRRSPTLKEGTRK